MILIGQIIGFFALILSVTSFQRNTHKGIMLHQLGAGILFTVHFILLGAPTGAVLNGIAAIRAAVFYFKDDKKWAAHPAWPAVFCISFIVFGIVSWESFLSVLPILAMIINTFSFSAVKPKIVRSTILLSSPFWWIYNLLTGSIAGVINESFVIISTIVGIIRYDLPKKKPAENLTSRCSEKS